METRNRKPIAKALAAALALALILAGCAGPDTVPDKEVSPTPAASQETAQTQAETERITMQKAAAEELEGYRWPQESVWKTILGEEVEFTLYHGNGWTIYVPAA